MEINSLTNSDLEQLLENYPWFSLARQEYISRMTMQSEESLRAAVSEAGIHLLSKKMFIKAVLKQQEKPAPVQTKPQPQYHVVGGDYFGQDDFKQLEQEGVVLQKMNIFSPINATLNAISRESGIEALSGTSDTAREECDEFVTETLAKVYAKQECYQRALDFYKKLILLYPEKSTYFALPIREIKNKLK